MSAAALAAAPPAEQKQLLGRALFPSIARWHPPLAPKLTGMLLEMDNCTLMCLLDSELLLQCEVDAALRVLDGAEIASSRVSRSPG